jgi:hypothetical protein
MRLLRLFTAFLLLTCASGCCCFKHGTFGTAYAPPAYSTPPVYQAPAVVQQQPQQIAQPATYVQAQTVCQPVVCQPVCNPCCP